MDRLGAETPSSCAMLGRAVASTVPSSCSMNMAAPTIRAMVRKWGLDAPEGGMVNPFRPGPGAAQERDFAAISCNFRGHFAPGPARPQACKSKYLAAQDAPVTEKLTVWIFPL